MFRQMSEILSKRKKFDVTITFTTTTGKKEVILAKYDGLFSSVEMRGATGFCLSYCI